MNRLQAKSTTFCAICLTSLPLSYGISHSTTTSCMLDSDYNVRQATTCIILACSTQTRCKHNPAAFFQGFYRLFSGFLPRSFFVQRLPFGIIQISRSCHGLPAPCPRADAPYQHMTFQSRPPAGRQLETASAITLVVVITIVLFFVFVFRDAMH